MTLDWSRLDSFTCSVCGRRLSNQEYRLGGDQCTRCLRDQSKSTSLPVGIQLLAYVLALAIVAWFWSGPALSGFIIGTGVLLLLLSDPEEGDFDV